MRVICIENALLVDEGENKGMICAHKGSIYHVIGSVEGQQMREKTGIPFASGPWYQFLEIDGLHHHIRFLELPDDDLVQTEKTKYETINIT